MLCATGRVTAQSGRRLPKSTEAPPPAEPERAPETATRPRVASSGSTKPDPARVSLIVGSYRLDPSASYPMRVHDIIMDSLVDRLRRSDALSVGIGGEMSRKEAIDRAKSETESYVVWIELGTEDDMGRSSTSIGVQNPRRVFVNYTIFKPGTSKVLSHGRVYQGTYRAGTGTVGIGVPRPGMGRLPVEYSLAQAGYDTADRIMDAFSIPHPSWP
jgi:hypothetical protein